MLDAQQICWMNTWMKWQAKLDYQQGEWEISKFMSYSTHLWPFLLSLPTPVEHHDEKEIKFNLI